MRVHCLLAVAVCGLSRDALARAPASANYGSRKYQCRDQTCACGVCRLCRTQQEKEVCQTRAGGDAYKDSGENGTYYLNDDGELVKEDTDA